MSDLYPDKSDEWRSGHHDGYRFGEMQYPHWHEMIRTAYLTDPTPEAQGRPAEYCAGYRQGQFDASIRQPSRVTSVQGEP